MSTYESACRWHARGLTRLPGRAGRDYCSTANDVTRAMQLTFRLRDDESVLMEAVSALLTCGHLEAKVRTSRDLGFPDRLQ